MSEELHTLSRANPPLEKQYKALLDIMNSMKYENQVLTAKMKYGTIEKRNNTDL